ncbi:hypothetical protein [Azonexus sp. R2A61]|uniref:hypothetical protein n=1 Tax=Azonexus sp. R2A61 TaxID=2744443 RepID=UPI001F17FBB2|nr:hypothetical protein [Azonexus sp. R2A61]
MVAFLYTLAAAFISHLMAIVMLVTWLLKKRWRHFLIAVASAVTGGVAGFMAPSSGMSFYAIKADVIGFFLEFSLSEARATIGSALGLFLSISLIVWFSRRKVHA